MQIPQPRGVTFSDDLRSDASPGKLQPFLGGEIHTFAASNWLRIATIIPNSEMAKSQIHKILLFTIVFP